MNRKKGIDAKESGKQINEKGQENRMKEEIEGIENVTKYGEFISSYFAWIEPEKQKEKVDEIEKMTEK